MQETIRIRFSKEGRLKFIGHLDLMRTFQRALRRAEVPLAYSQGFNPHPLLYFANPLALGMTSEDEYADMTLEKPMDSHEVMNRLNSTLPEGLQVTSAGLLPEHAPSAMSEVTAARYRITMPVHEGYDWPMVLTSFLSQEQIIIRKVGKVRGRKQWMELDVKPMLYSWEIHSETVWELVCACGSTVNVKLDALMESLYQSIGQPDWVNEESIHRLNLYRTGEDGSRAGLMEKLVEQTADE